MRTSQVQMLTLNNEVVEHNINIDASRGSPKESIQLNLVFEEEMEGVNLNFETMTPC